MYTNEAANHGATVGAGMCCVLEPGHYQRDPEQQAHSAYNITITHSTVYSVSQKIFTEVF